ncbi:autotransporter outer membrane beta-barrel domain-containing protein [Mesorhizobium sp. RMAD-H1]|uniref:autotransporter outer membrane beta-barrel domain-containing protein n=1 Tax=Mesorhizobium sp. RMAD-H1 TaxID=2587065 RepID=UPI001616FF0D|nr:outer membrane autotransporter protein [Mesorhizobium sp. RMAD-H1]
MKCIELSDPVFLNSTSLRNTQVTRQNRHFQLVLLLLGSAAILPAFLTDSAQAACAAGAICVTRTTDNGDVNAQGSLSWAIAQANAGGNKTIAFDPAAFTGTDPKLTMTGTNVQTPRISAGVTIDGSDVPGLTIDGSNEREIFFVRPDNPNSGNRIDVTIRNLSLVNGRAKGGDGNLGVNGSGYASGGGMGAGGALFAGDGSDVTLDNVDVEGNTAQGGKGETVTQSICCTPTGAGGGGLNGGNGETNTGGVGGGGGGTGAGANAANNHGGGPNGGTQGGGNGGDYSGGGGGNNGNGGNGGFGGGGGGGSGNGGVGPAKGGNGGFGGGGGGASGIAGTEDRGGDGGFGGGGGGGTSRAGESSKSKYGGGAGGPNNGGGGAGFGGGVFGENGSTISYKGNSRSSGNSAIGGSGYHSGLGLGSGIFLNGRTNATFIAGQGETITVNDDIASDSYNGPGNANNPDPAGDGIDGGVVKNDRGMLVLRGNNSYAGGTRINQGTVNVAADRNLGHVSSRVTIGDGSLQFAGSFASDRRVTLTDKTSTIDTQANNNTLNGVVDGAGALNKLGTGGLTLTAVNTYTGDTNIDEGAVKLVGNGSIEQSNRVKADQVFDISGISGPSAKIRRLAGAGTGRVHLGSKELVITNANDTFAGVIDGTGRLNVDGGWETLTGTNTYTGGTKIGKAGVVELGNGGTSGSITGNVEDDGTFIFNRSDLYTFGGDISGIGDVHQVGAGKTVLTGKNSHSGITTVDRGTLAAGARNTFSANSDHIVRKQTVLDLAGYDQTVKSLANAGLVNLGGRPGTTLTTRQAYAGQEGYVHFNSVLDGDGSPTDMVHVGGATSGKSYVIVSNMGGLGNLTKEGIKIVDVDGASDGLFELVGNYQNKYGKQGIGFGAFSYSLEKGGVSTPDDGDWYLRGTYQPGVALYEAYPQLLLAMNTLPTLRQRVGNRYWSGAGNLMIEQGDGPGIADVPPSPEDAGPSALVERRAVWGRVESSYSRMRPETSTSDAESELTLWRGQAGLDGQFYENESGVLIGSLTGHYTSGTADVSSPYGDGEIETKGAGFGGALTWYGYDGFYVDGQAQVTWYKSDITSSLLGSSMASGLKGLGYAAGVETGRRFELNGRWTLTPQAQLVYSRIDFDDFTDRAPFLADVSLEKGESLLGRTGLQLDYQQSWQADNGTTSRISAYGAGNLYYEFLDGTRVSVGSVRKVSFANENDRIWGGLGVGGAYNWADDRYSLYGEAFARTSLASFPDSYSIGGSIGLRVRW